MGVWWCIRTPWSACVQIDEFGGGSNDGCGPYALMTALANWENRTPVYSEAEALRSTMIAAGQWAGPGQGCRVEHLLWALAHNFSGRYAARESALYDGTIYGTDRLNQILGSFPGLPTVFLVTNAQALPGNEANIHGHFVSALGFDQDAQKVLISNSDIAGRRGVSACEWITLGQLAAAQPGGYIVVRHADPPPPPPPPPATVTIDKAQLAKALADLDAALAALHKLTGV